MGHVISASRRTDIPGFFSDWLIGRLKAGFVFVQQPYNNRITRVSLEPADVSAFFFCSKNYRPLLNKLETIEKTSRNLFFHFTITANRELESNTPDYREAIKDYLYIARRYTPDHIIWRFDPICITDRLSFEVHEERFSKCADLLRGQASRCIISFAHPYKKVLANFKKYTDHIMTQLSSEQKHEYSRRLALSAAKFGIQLYACCNDDIVSEDVLKGSCIDGRHMTALFKTPIDVKPAATRKQCACTKSIDIGAYDTCAHGCIYCYANMDREKAISMSRRHNPEWNSLRINIDEKSIVQGKGKQAAFLF